jgi:signal transduction histidine kinase
MMPNLHGYGVLLAIRAEALLSNTPFIFLTARADKSDLRRGMALGADDYLTKPFTLTELLESVRSRLQRHENQRAEFKDKLETLNDALTQEHERFILKSRFVSMVSHEFRTPLTVILSSNSLLRDYAESFSREQKQVYSEYIEQAVMQLTGLLDTMLLIGKMETGRLNFIPAKIYLEAFCREILDGILPLVGSKHKLTFISNYKKEINGDTNLLRLIINNLVTNALKYSPEGGEVIFEIGNDQENVIIKVKDSGIGIPLEDQPHLFDVFHRASNVGEIKGTGLGLVIVKSAVELHGGCITFESVPGLGSTFTVTIPA